MTYEEESYLLDTVTENNKMLNQLISVVNRYVINHNKENEEDFTRNIMANMMSEIFMGKKKKG